MDADGFEYCDECGGPCCGAHGWGSSLLSAEDSAAETAGIVWSHGREHVVAVMKLLTAKLQETNEMK
jgi:hypothetical protein